MMYKSLLSFLFVGMQLSGSDSLVSHVVQVPDVPPSIVQGLQVRELYRQQLKRIQSLHSLQTHAYTALSKAEIKELIDLDPSNGIREMVHQAKLREEWLQQWDKKKDALPSQVILEGEEGYAGKLSEDGKFCFIVSASSRDGRRAIAGVGDNDCLTLRRMCLQSGKKREYTLIEQDTCPAVFFQEASAGKRFIVGLKGKELQIWRNENDDCIVELRIVMDLRFATMNASGDTIVATDYARRAWRLKVAESSDKESQVHSIDDLRQMLLDQEPLITAVQEFPMQVTGHFALDRAGLLIAFATAKGIEVWNSKNQKLVQTCDLPENSTISRLSFCPRERFILIGLTNGEIGLLDRETGLFESLVSFEQSHPPYSSVGLAAIQWSVDGRYAALTASDEISHLGDRSEETLHRGVRETIMYDMVANENVRWRHDDKSPHAAPSFNWNKALTLDPSIKTCLHVITGEISH